MGEVSMTALEISRVLDRLRPEFMAGDYHMINK